MRVSGLLSGAFALHVLLTARCMPLHEGRGLRKHKEPPGLSQIPHSLSEKRRDPQDTFKPHALQKMSHSSTPNSGTALGCRSTTLWRPRLPRPERSASQQSPRQKRFVIFGGRWPKNDLTYK
ncbi:stromelysin-3-like [Carassius auratus]|uniref:Stromelysin-3-like n=1 Tax=Carassius auratus TaxID=7957 RepID=A0A6P6PU24_CARAU|nr:stromelysin-3-like [Carassius auratus]